jgi:hypothetical protein
MNGYASRLIRALLEITEYERDDVPDAETADEFIDALNEYIDHRIAASLDRVTRKIG